MRKKILGLNIDFDLTYDQVLNQIEDLIKGEGCHLVATTSPYFVMVAEEDKDFKKIVNNAALSVPDGVGVLYAKYFLDLANKINSRNILFPIKVFILGLYAGATGFVNRSKLGSTITGVELTYRLCELSAEKGYTIIFLGGRRRDKSGNIMPLAEEDMSNKAANTFRRLYPNIRIIGATSRYSRDARDDDDTIQYIHDCMNRHNVDNVDLLFVAYNPIEQEKWIHRNASRIPSRVSLGIGRTFDYITDEMKQPPKVYDKLHIKWLYALLIQPWRVRRIFMTILLFPLKVYKSVLKNTDI